MSASDRSPGRALWPRLNHPSTQGITLRHCPAVSAYREHSTWSWTKAHEFTAVWHNSSRSGSNAIAKCSVTLPNPFLVRLWYRVKMEAILLESTVRLKCGTLTIIISTFVKENTVYDNEPNKQLMFHFHINTPDPVDHEAWKDMQVSFRWFISTCYFRWCKNKSSSVACFPYFAIFADGEGEYCRAR